jgi:5-methylcytosine-specific restriction endonuclease McrA
MRISIGGDGIDRQRYTERTKQLRRSHNYRQRYFEHHKGIRIKFLKEPNAALFFCPYCGRMMVNKSKMAVDHIYAVRRVQYTKALRERFKALDDGVNHISNLVACCKRCNARKGKKAGLWIFLGQHGAKFMPVVRLLAFAALVTGAVLFLVHFVLPNL